MSGLVHQGDGRISRKEKSQWQKASILGYPTIQAKIPSSHYRGTLTELPYTTLFDLCPFFFIQVHQCVYFEVRITDFTQQNIASSFALGQQAKLTRSFCWARRANHHQIQAGRFTFRIPHPSPAIAAFREHLTFLRSLLGLPQGDHS